MEKGILLNSINISSNVSKFCATTDIKFADTKFANTKYEKSFTEKSFKEYIDSANDRYQAKNASIRKDSKFNVSRSSENLNNSKVTEEDNSSGDKKVQKPDSKDENVKKNKDMSKYDVNKSERKEDNKAIPEEEILDKTGISQSQLQNILAALGINENWLMDSKITQQLIDTINYAILCSGNNAEAVNMLIGLEGGIFLADSNMLQGDLDVQANEVQDSRVQNLLQVYTGEDAENDAAGSEQSMEGGTADGNEAKSKLERLIQELMQQGSKIDGSKAEKEMEIFNSYMNLENKLADNETENEVQYQQIEKIDNALTEVESPISINLELDESSNNENETFMYARETLANNEMKDNASVESDVNFSQEQNDVNSSNSNYFTSAGTIGTAGTTNASSISETSTAVREHLFEQVMEKAKVMIDGGKSEMVLDLQPENFGKLSLKVVTERGIVIAKIVTENEQVKEVLETNMQLLKDSLQNQGLTVGNISVSVGNQHDSQWERREMLYQEHENKNLELKSVAVDKNSIYVQNEALPVKQNGYLWDQTNIDLMA